MPAVTSATTEALGGLRDVRELWERLEAPMANPFASWLFADVWWRHLGDGAALDLRAVRCGNDVVGILPLCRRGDELRLLGHVDGDVLGPVCAPGHRRECLLALRAHARRSGTTLIADELPAGSSGVLGGKVVRRTPSPVVDVPPGGFKALLASRSANLRQGVRRRRRLLECDHDVRVRTADEQTLAHDLRVLIDLHNLRWDGTTEVFSGARVAMHRELAGRFLARGWLRLRVLQLDGRPVAANYALRVGGGEWYYQAGRDPRLAPRSVGAVLQAECIRLACEEGAREYRMLRGDQRYKLSWANRDAPVETVRVDPQ